MQLAWVRLVGVGPFDDVEFPFRDEDGTARPLTVVYGGPGVGKTTLLAAVGATRPGHATVLQPFGYSAEPAEAPAGGVAPHAVCDWLLGADDVDRPHPLTVATPSARVHRDEEREALRRREQSLYDRVAREGGFAFLSIPSSRWFSRQPLSLNAPLRTLARYDVRGALGEGESTRADLARDTKQALAYAAIAAALAPGHNPRRLALAALGTCMSDAVNELVAPAGYRYEGLDAASFEPVFRAATRQSVAFDALPTRVRQLASLAALAVRTAWAARPERDPRDNEVVVLVDDVDLHLDPGLAAALLPALGRALPRAQWIVTTSSALLAGAADARAVLALRRKPDSDAVELFTGEEARMH